MNKEPSQLKINYNYETRVISLQAYDEGFFSWERDITQEIMECAVEKLFDDMDCPTNGGVIQLERVNDKRNGVNKILAEVIDRKDSKFNTSK
jgi:hypothetical protein